MGGDAFSQAVSRNGSHPTLSTPRMDPTTYVTLRDIYAQKLADCLPSARILPYKEAPEKTSHGDIDYLIATSDTVNFPELAQQIGAAAYLHRGPKGVSFAVKHDGQASDKPIQYIDVAPDRSNARQPSKTHTEEAYAQIDLALVSPDDVDWRMFLSAYSDLSGIIGNIIRNVGFTLNHSGLYLRLAELDKAKSKDYVNVPDADGMVFLTNDTATLMLFLGLDVERYEAGFTTLAEMYSWLAECRYMYPETIAKQRDISRDRQKARSRPIFTNFFAEWLPQNKPAFAAASFANIASPGDGSPDAASDSINLLATLRTHALQTAIGFFQKDEIYSAKHTALLCAISNAKAAHLLKPIIASASGKQGAGLTEVLRAFRRWVGFGESGQPVVLDARHADAEAVLYRVLDESGEGIRERERVEEWVVTHWEEVRARERMRGKEYI